MFTVLLGVALAAILLQVLHLYVSTPIKPGQVVAPGVWLSKCGLRAFSSDCQNAFLHMGRDGKLKMYNAQKQVAWEIQGEVCNNTDKDCVRGLQVKEDGSLNIGGKPVQWMAKYDKNSDLSPWPFVQKPKIKIWNK